jgi:hypothetical protein
MQPGLREEARCQGVGDVGAEADKERMELRSDVGGVVAVDKKCWYLHLCTT